MLWVTLLATAAVALAEVEIITSPTPGNEYVHISGSPQDAKNSTDASRISVKDEGLSGIQHKHYQNKKIEHHPVKKENLGVKATVKDEGLSGVVKKQSGIGVPPLKHMDEPKYDVIGHHKSHKWEGGIDFDDDLPLSDKKLKPAGTSQSSRVNVKKGPNGQEYEYEYVYYYYDDEDDATTVAPAHAPAPTPVRGQYSEVDRPTSSRRPSSEVSEEPRIRGELVKQKNVESGQEPPRSRGDSIDHRGGHRVVEVTEIDEEELHRRRTESRNDDRSKNRYTTIERGSGSSGGRGRGDAVAVTTAEPSVNEVLPSRGAQRSRGRQVETAVIEDDRLPANTRFPSRGRSSSVATTIPPQPSAPAQTQTSRSRTQGSGPTIRRPSLVDSSSFRTHASDPAPAADFDRNYYRSSPVLDNTRESDLEEYVQPELVRPTTFVPAQTTLPPSPLPLPDQREQSMPDKAALDLYAILQQQQEENSVSGLGGDAYLPTELITTPEPTTVTTTTTTTTPAPTTTTTTTTTTPPPPPVGRGRFRGAAPGSRTRLRPGASTTTTTTEAPQEEEAPRRKFSPSNSGRSPGQVSAYGRRGAGARASTTTSAPEQEASTARTRASFGGNRNSYRARGRTTPAPSNPEEEAAPEGTSASTTTSRPTRPRLNVSAATRPLRPGPRINLRGRPGISTTAATPAAAPEDEEPASPSSTSPPPPPAEEEASPSPAAPTDALTRLRNRPRLKVTPRQPGAAAPTAAAPRPPPVGFRRPGRPLSQQQTSAAPEEPAPAPTEPAPPPTEAAAVDAAPTEPPPPSPLPPHLARRRPAIRRLQIPHHPQQ